MIFPPRRYWFAPVFVGAVALGMCARAQEVRDRVDSSRPATTSRSTAATTTRAAGATRTSSRGTLPDPVLLDGSTQPAEKKNEHGMLGEFEIPGDENVRNGRVGGQQGGQPGGGQQQTAGMPGGGGGGSPGQQGQSGGGAQGAQQAGGGQEGQQGQGGAGNQAGGPGAGNQVAGGGDPNAKAEGTQVGQLQGDGAGGQSGPTSVQKPQDVKIGDSSMQIQGIQNPATVVGGVNAGSTQQSENAMGAGGSAKGGGGSRDGRGVERGRAIPAGL